jgi:hypothetical protein
MGSRKKLFVLLLLLPVALCAKAGTGIGKVEGVLNGYVTDAVTKKPLPGVVVSATIPGTNNQKEVLTDADGYFRFAELPASQVTVEFNKKGYQPAKRPNITIREKTAVSPVFLLHMRLKIYVDVMPSKFADTLRYPSYKSTHEHGECCTGLRSFFAIHPKGPVNHLLRVAKCPFPHHFPGRFFPVHEDAGPVDLSRKPGVTHKP